MTQDAARGTCTFGVPRTSVCSTHAAESTAGRLCPRGAGGEVFDFGSWLLVSFLEPRCRPHVSCVTLGLVLSLDESSPNTGSADGGLPLADSQNLPSAKLLRPKKDRYGCTKAMLRTFCLLFIFHGERALHHLRGPHKGVRETAHLVPPLAPESCCLSLRYDEQTSTTHTTVYTLRESCTRNGINISHRKPEY